MEVHRLVFVPSLDTFWTQASLVCDEMPGLNQMLGGVACELLRDAEARAAFEGHSHLMGTWHGEVCQ